MSMLKISNGRITGSLQTALHGDAHHDEVGRVSSYWHAMYKKKVGTDWFNNNDASQTDIDREIASYPAFNSLACIGNLEEVNFGTLIFNAGTYKVSFATIKHPDSGILEILHGAVSLGTYDCYAAVAAYDQVGSFTYSPAANASGTLRIRVNGENVAGSGTFIGFISRLEIIRTG